MFQNQAYGITVFDPKHGPATQGTQKMRDRAALAPAPLTPPHISFIHTTLALSEEGPGCPSVICWSHHYPVIGRTQGPLSFPLLI